MTGWILLTEGTSLPFEFVPHDAVGPPSLVRQECAPSLFCGSRALTAGEHCVEQGMDAKINIIQE